MTTEKMPDIFYLSRWPHCEFYVEREHEDDEKGYRAKPVEELLKKALDVLHRLRNDATTQDHVNANKTITAIDKFLGEDK